MSGATGVKAVVEVLARALADRPDEVHVVETAHKGTTLVELYVAPGDAGKLIGRQGRTVAALRTLASTAGEKEGKTVELLVIPALDPFEAMVRTAVQLEASRLVVGVSARMASEELARRVGLAWEGLPERRPFSLEITNPDRPSIYVNLGPHPPRLWPEDVERVHSLWLKLSEQPDVGSKLHHRDIVGVALQRLERDVEAGLSGDVMRDLDAEMHRPH